MTPLHIDIFCAVIDNFGDAGVCWRLARQLAHEHGCWVRLWVDRPEVLAALMPGTEIPATGAEIDGVWVADWGQAAVASPAQLVIEAFACELPLAYFAAMVRERSVQAWINLEYLSAEDWVEGSHGLPSVHPQTGLRKHFFFPGFTAKTGGLLKEAALDARREAFSADTVDQQLFWDALGVTAPHAEQLKVSLFAYENDAVASLLKVWSQGAREVYCAAPLGRITPQLAGWLGEAQLQAGQVFTRGQLTVAVLPFMPQPDYDRLLWACDLNFVRGEDSFVRAQWAGKPFVWHIYQQEEAEHKIKLRAFLQHYLAGLDESASQALQAFWLAWEAQSGVAECWPAFEASLSTLRAHTRDWSKRVSKHGDLAAKLLIFCENLLESRAL